MELLPLLVDLLNVGVELALSTIELFNLLLEETSSIEGLDFPHLAPAPAFAFLLIKTDGGGVHGDQSEKSSEFHFSFLSIIKLR